MWVELSSESGVTHRRVFLGRFVFRASRLGACCLWGEMSCFQMDILKALRAVDFTKYALLPIIELVRLFTIMDQNGPNYRNGP